jgi:hypothetical protein
MNIKSITFGIMILFVPAGSVCTVTAAPEDTLAGGSLETTFNDLRGEGMSISIVGKQRKGEWYI